MSDNGQTTTTTAAPWFAGFDEEQRGWLQNRGLDKKTAPEAAAQLIKDFRETQGKLGIPADRVIRVPADANDEANWKIVHQKLGVPDTPEGYDFTAVKFADGSPLDDDLVKFLRETSAKNHLTPQAALGVATELARLTDETKTQEANAAGVSLAAAQRELAVSWGPNLDANNFIAHRTAGMLGFDKEFIDALPGDKYVPFMQKMLEAGGKMGEARLFGLTDANGGAPGVPRTREAALARIEELKKDSAWYARWKAGDVAATREWDHLHTLLMQRAG